MNKSIMFLQYVAETLKSIGALHIEAEIKEVAERIMPPDKKLIFILERS